MTEIQKKGDYSDMTQHQLAFTVTGQHIAYTPPDTPPVADTRRYLHAAFDFDDTWDGLHRLAVFTGIGVGVGPAARTSYTVELDEQGTCEFPAAVITSDNRLLQVGVIGYGEGDYRLTTDTCTVTQLKSCFRAGKTPPPPAPDVYASILAIAKAAEESVRKLAADIDSGALGSGGGITPHIGANGHWYIGSADTGVVAEGTDGTDGTTPHIGANGHWYIGETDTGVVAEGTDGTDGVSITDILLNGGEDPHTYTLQVHLSDGQVLDAGEIAASDWSPIFVDSLSEMTDTSRTYVLTETGMIYTYGKKTVAGTGDVNRLDKSAVQLNKRLNSGGAAVDCDGSIVVSLSFSEVASEALSVDPYWIRVKGASLSTVGSMTCRIREYTASGLGSTDRTAYNSFSTYNEAADGSMELLAAGIGVSETNHAFQLGYLGGKGTDTLDADFLSNCVNYGMLLCMAVNTDASAVTEDQLDDIIITYNDPIDGVGTSDSGTEIEGWFSTGMAYAPADYESRILSLETDMDEIHESLGTDTRLPDYWQTHLAEKADKIRLAMEAAGRQKSAFLWYTDAHWANGSSHRSPGILRYLIRHTPMNKVNFGGDILGDSLLASRADMAYLYDWRAAIRGLPNHHSVIGNHDDFKSDEVTYEDGGFTYAFLLAAEESADMVAGGDFCYYIDNPCEQTRYLYLDTGCYSVSDFPWLIEALGGVPDGWHIVVISHIWFQYTDAAAPTVGAMNPYAENVLSLLDAYNARESGSLTAANGVAYPYDFTTAAGHVAFCIGGHSHCQHTLASAGGIPVILTPPDANQVRGEDTYTTGTVTEASVCGVVADYKNQKISLIFVGRGTDAEIALDGGEGASA